MKKLDYSKIIIAVAIVHSIWIGIVSKSVLYGVVAGFSLTLALVFAFVVVLKLIEHFKI